MNGQSKNLGGERPPLMKLTGLWIGKDKNGNTYLEGTVSPSLKLMVFKNRRKNSGSKEPDFEAYLTQPASKGKQTAGEAATAEETNGPDADQCEGILDDCDEDDDWDYTCNSKFFGGFTL